MNIGIITVAFPVSSETFVVDHIRALENRGNNVSIFTDHLGDFSPPCFEGLHDLQEKTYQLGNCPKSKAKRFYKGILILLKSLCFRDFKVFRTIDFFKFGKKAFSLSLLHECVPFFDIDAIHVHHGTAADYWILLKKVFPEKRFIVSFHGADVREAYRLNKNMYDDVFRYADTITYNSQIYKEKLISLGCPEEKLYFWKNGVSYKSFEVRQHTNLGLNILTVARLHKVKDISFACRIVKNIIDSGFKNIIYNIIGDGPMRMEIQALVKDLEIQDNVFLHGSKSHLFVKKTMAKSDIFLLTSIDEPFGVVLVEAQAAGLPIVATNIGGIPEAVNDGETAFLMKKRDVSLASSLMISLITNPDLRKEMGQAGRKRVKKHFDSSKIYDGIFNLYQR